MTTRSTRSPRRRTVVALAVVLVVLGAFLVRLVDIQVVKADEYVAQSLDKALGASRTLYGTRGSIVDETGQTLAGSVLTYDCQVSPQLITQIDGEIAAGESSDQPWSQTSVAVASILGQDTAAVQKIVADALAVDAQSQFASLAKGLSTEQYRALDGLGLAYLACFPQSARTYPDGAVAGNLVGFVGSDGTPLEGLEAAQESCLDATDGELDFQKGKDGVIIPGTEREKPAVDGGTLQLTINRDLQWYLQQLIAEQSQNMGAAWGAITVVEVKTGKIRAAAEYPTVDPNNIDATDPAYRSSRIFRGTFEPGSTFKALTAAIVMDAAGVTPLSTVVAAGDETFPNGARVTDPFDHEAYDYTLAGVLIDSSNVGISKFSDLVSPQTRVDYLKKFGIGEGSAVGFPGEEAGIIHPVDAWDPQTQYNTAFGQGLTTTVPELAGAYSAIANDGLRMPLSIVESCTKPDGTVVTPKEPAPVQVVAPDTAAGVRSMLENVNVQGGLASQVAIDGYRLGIKTGTGEKADLVNGGYKAGVYFTSLTGMAPIDDPEYVVVVTMDEPTTVRSSAANASAFQKAMTQVLKTYRVMPSTTEPTLFPKFG